MPDQDRCPNRHPALDTLDRVRLVRFRYTDEYAASTRSSPTANT